MKVNQILAISLQSLKSNRLRTALTILGVVVGIFSIIVIMNTSYINDHDIVSAIKFIK